MRRRDFLTLVGGAAAWPLTARGQQTGRVHRVGVLFVGSGPGSVPDAAFRSGLRERGYIEGQNIVIEFRSALGKLDALPSLATELVALNLDVIFAPAEAALRSCLQASRTVPIVIASADYDPVESGFVTSLARPRGNVTGVFFRQVEISGKRVELLKEIVPRLSRIATLVDPSGSAQLDETERAARSLGISFKAVQLSLPPDFEKAFDAMVNEQVGALALLATPITYAHRARIASLAINNRIPAIAPFDEFVDEGGLLSYGASFATLFHYAAYYVDRILRGATPGRSAYGATGQVRPFHQSQDCKSAQVNDPAFLASRSKSLSRMKMSACGTSKTYGDDARRSARGGNATLSGHRRKAGFDSFHTLSGANWRS